MHSFPKAAAHVHSKKPVGCMPSRRNNRHGVGPDGGAATDEDTMAKAMGRKAASNLDFSGINKCTKSFLTFPTPLIASKLNNLGVSLGSSINSISVSANALRGVEFDRIILTPTILSKSDTSLSEDDDEEVYAVSDGQLLTHLVGEVSEVGLDDGMLHSCIELQAAERKSRLSSIKINAWPNKKAKVTRSPIVSK
jgi:hypothetical protein